MIAINERPYTWNWSMNDIRYVFTLDDLTRPGLSLQVKLKYRRNGITKDIVTVPYIPNSDGKVYVYVQGYLNSIVSYTLPVIGDDITIATDQFAEFWIEFRESTTADPSPAWTSDEANSKYVIKGGIQKEKHARNNSFINHFEVAKPFLSWQPKERHIFPDQKIHLTYFNFQGKVNPSILIKIYNDDETIIEDGFTLSFGADDLIVHILLNNFIDDANTGNTKNVVKIDVFLIEASLAITETRSFILLYRPLYDYADLFFHNSIGGFDTIRVRGEMNFAMDRSVTEAGNGVDVNQWNSQVISGEIRHVAINKTDRFSGDIGYLPKKEQEPCIDFLMSTNAYEIIDSRYIPVLELEQAKEIRKSTDKRYSFPIEWKRAISNSVFTPSAINFGEGEL